MEDVLAVYQRSYDPARPVVCFDESNKLLQSEKRRGEPAAPDAVAKQDYSYAPQGHANLFMFCEPLRGWRRVAVTQRRCGSDLAEQLKRLVDEDYPSASVIVLVCDNLNTHHPGVLYERYAPAEARRIAERLEWHYTPEHGSWLNIAEIELSVLQAQCLCRRIADQQTLAVECAANCARRNTAQGTVNWQFTAADARIKLRHLYPLIRT